MSSSSKTAALREARAWKRAMGLPRNWQIYLWDYGDMSWDWEVQDPDGKVSLEQINWTPRQTIHARCMRTGETVTGFNVAKVLHQLRRKSRAGLKRMLDRTRRRVEDEARRAGQLSEMCDTFDETWPQVPGADSR